MAIIQPNVDDLSTQVRFVSKTSTVRYIPSKYTLYSLAQLCGKRFIVAMNHLAHRIDEEVNLWIQVPRGLTFPYNTDEFKDELPVSLDWHSAGAVTPVKDQSVCRS